VLDGPKELAMTLTDTPPADLVEAAVLERVLHEALRRGGEFAEVFAEDRASSGISLDDRRVEELSSGHDRGAGIRVIVGETTGFAHTADLSERGLLAAAEAAAAVAREGGAPVREIALARQSLDPRSTVRTFPSTVAKSAKVDLLLRADDAARSAGGAIVQVSAGYGDSRRRILVANSDGLLTGDDRVRTRFVVTCVASGDGGMQTGFHTFAFTRGYEVFEDHPVEEVATEAARRALTKLTARPAPSGMHPVVIKSGSGGMLFHEACGHGLEADHIVKDSSVYTGRLGQLVASPGVTLVDDGTFGSYWGSLEIDDEGRPAQRSVLIQDGVLTDYMWDYLRARKQGRTSSGNGRRQSYQDLPMVRMTNTFLLAGEEQPEEIVSQTPYGVYVAQLGGGQVNTATGDFVFGMTEAYLIEDGRITEPLRNANLIGNGPDVISRIDAVGNDFELSSGTCGKDGQSVPVGCGQPTLRVSGVTIGGTASA
jgi:TldD protein